MGETSDMEARLYMRSDPENRPKAVMLECAGVSEYLQDVTPNLQNGVLSTESYYTTGELCT